MLGKNILSKSASTHTLLTRQAWGAMRNSHTIDTTNVRPVIAASWQRCLLQNIDPCQPAPFPSVITDEITQANDLLLRIAQPHMHELHSLLGSEGYMVMLLCKEGYIVHLLGGACTVRQAERLHVFSGAMLAEENVGTFAPGLCFEEQCAVQVLQCEHYREQYHDWSCSAVPMQGLMHNMIGVLNVTSIGQVAHPPQLLSLVQLTARTIEAEFQYALLQSAHHNLHAQCRALVEHTATGVVLLDQADCVSYASPTARRLLHLQSKDLVGQRGQDMFTGYSTAKQTASKNKGKLRVDLPLSQLGMQNIQAQLHCVEPGNPNAGVLVHLTEAKESTERQRPVLRYTFADIIHKSQMMHELLAEAQDMADSRYTVLIQGESGTGKEMLAQAIHQASARAQKPFIAVNCAALAKELLQSELFGYEGGSFTGARKQGHRGKFEQAEGGTIFLDEIGDMPLEAQANLLRIVQEQQVVRLGGSQSIPLQVRIIAATNKPLFQAVEQGTFRHDLYYRLAVMNLHIPPLRERPEDIEALVLYYMDKHARNARQIAPQKISREARQVLLTYPWPGNARELENAVIYIVSKMTTQTVMQKDLPPALLALQQGKNKQATINSRGVSSASSVLGTENSLDTLERQAIGSALAACNGRVGAAAQLLGIHRVTLYRKLQRLGLE